MSNPRLFTQKLSAFWDWLTEPRPGIQDVVLRRKLRLLAAFSLILVVLFLSFDVINILITPNYRRPLPAYGGYALFGVVYGLNRANYYRLAAWIFSTTHLIVVSGIVWLNAYGTPVTNLTFFLLGLVLISMLLTTRDLLILVTLNIIAIVSLSQLTPASISPESVLVQIALNIIFAILIAIATHQRNQDEQDRQAELRQSEKSLQKARTELEIRVAERTRELQESEARWRSLVENTPDTILTIDTAAAIVSINRTTTGRPIEEVRGRSIFDYLQPEYRNSARQVIDDVFSQGIPASYEMPGPGLNNKPAWFLIRIDPIKQDKQVAAATIVISDITERRQAELQLKASLEEKEALLKEIHHRVKNNLQVVASMLNMQTRYTDDEQVIGQLLESRNRIYSMALVHENLYRSETLAQVDSVAYISDLVNNILQSYDLEAGKIELKLAVEPILLTIDQAVPCGLILNELVTNALKHAFPKT
ncbi:MAG TPA: histidine kinase dimerization/phosphoacceptor domain -containing protein, partial [Anaerolineae bacterium]|nr:histidine kinase dimerization/phosphoacceptor domain -containing protein [Anaerolineae bacterium]